MTKVTFHFSWMLPCECCSKSASTTLEVGSLPCGGCDNCEQCEQLHTEAQSQVEDWHPYESIGRAWDMEVHEKETD